nr:MAG TPA: zipper dimerization domain transcription factor-like protein [Caudoviricetes sp.]
MGFKKNSGLEAAMLSMQIRIDALEARIRALEAKRDELTAHTPADDDDNSEERFRKGYEAILGYDYQKAMEFGGDGR